MKRTGFTLIELLVVILIMSIAVLIAGCGGGGGGGNIAPPPNNDGNNGGDSGGFAAWSGLIGFAFHDYRYGIANSYQSHLITPQGNKDISSQFSFTDFIRWSPDGNYLTNGKQVLDREGNLVRTFTKVEEFSWFPDSSGVLVGIYFDGLYKLSVSGEDKLLIRSSTRTYDHNPIVSPDGQWVYFVHHEYGNNGYVKRISLADLLEGKNSATTVVKLTTIFDESVIILPLDNERLVLGYSSKVELFDVPSKIVVASITVNASDIRLSPDGTKIVMLCSSAPAIRIVNAATFAALYNIAEPTNVDFRAIDWSPDGQSLVIGMCDYSGDDNVCKASIWRISDPRLQTIFSYPTGSTSPSTKGYYSQGFGVSWTE